MQIISAFLMCIHHILREIELNNEICRLKSVLKLNTETKVGSQNLTKRVTDYVIKHLFNTGDV